MESSLCLHNLFILNTFKEMLKVNGTLMGMLRIASRVTVLMLFIDVYALYTRTHRLTIFLGRGFLVVRRHYQCHYRFIGGTVSNETGHWGSDLSATKGGGGFFSKKTPECVERGLLFRSGNRHRH